MEDPRISRMYLAMIERAASRAGGRLRSGEWLRSSTTWIVLLVLILLGVGVAIREKGRGHLTKIKTELGATPPAPVEVVRPGGQEPMVLTRSQLMGGVLPEFASATLLPGRGMNLLQIMVNLPGKGEVALLDAPSLAEAAQMLNGLGEDMNGEASLAVGGAMEAPWAGLVSGAALPGGSAVLANWQGRGLTLPVNSSGELKGAQVSLGGLLLKRAADSSGMSTTPNGTMAEGRFDADNFDGHWPSKTEVRTTVLLGSRSIDLTMTAKNVGSEPEPMGLGWRPRFALPLAERAQMMLRLPMSQRVEVADRRKGLPTGRILPVEGTEYDFTAHGGTALKSLSLDDSFVRLKSGTMSLGPEVELRNPSAGFGLRMTAMTPSIKALRVVAPADKGSIMIDMQTNYDDPFGREWDKDEATGLVVLQPGESMQWKVRLELFQLTGPQTVP